MAAQNVAFLLDSAPKVWCSREDIHEGVCKALVAEGVRPVLVFSENLSPEMEARFRATGAEIASISYSRGVLSYCKELDDLVDRYQITTAHIQFFDYFSAMSWIARTRKIPHVIYEMPNGGLFTARSWKRMLLRLRNRIATFPTARIIAISDFVKEQLVAGGVAENKIITRYLGIDTSRFKPDPEARQRLAAKFAIEPEDLIISTVSYLKPIKNPQTIVEACGELKRREIPFHLFVAGDGEMMDELQLLTRQLDIAEQTHWLGMVSDPSELLQASDLFVLATIGEAFGLVLAEAMACGVPVVGSRSGGIREVVLDGETGLLVPPLDSVAFADAIQKLGTDRGLRKQCGQQAIERVHQCFSLQRSVENTMRIYEEIWTADQMSMTQ